MAREIIEPDWLIMVRLYTPTLLAIGSVVAAWLAAAFAFWLRVRDHGRRIRELEKRREADIARIQADREHDNAAVERKLDRIEDMVGRIMQALIKP
ncbi:hypothetical protein [Albimonas pacifica]|uniref:Uncharacterized protein n=1 Tax=Albimonas pacifica TaxID=1114924 RepID=A0A1I3JMD3_9RHOB|nr:hypothetical protein [Albimonas pacifica]SFI61148.1 hypothetical protein SAMN05216258_10860 [Albimonas pacifica]